MRYTQQDESVTLPWKLGCLVNNILDFENWANTLEDDVSILIFGAGKIA